MASGNRIEMLRVLGFIFGRMTSVAADQSTALRAGRNPQFWAANARLAELDIYFAPITHSHFSKKRQT